MQLWRKVRNVVFVVTRTSPPALSTQLKEQIHGQIHSFYITVSDGLGSLERSFLSASTNFRIEHLQLGVDFLHVIHSQTFFLIQALWPPVGSKVGLDLLTQYLEISMRLLDMCNQLKQCLSSLEDYHMSLEIALHLLSSTSKGVQENQSPKKSNFLSAIKQDLWRFGAGFAEDQLSKLGPTLSNIWRSITSSYRLSFFDVRTLVSNSGVNVNDSDDMSVVLADAHIITSFVSSLLVWIIVGSSEVEFYNRLNSPPIDSHEPRSTCYLYLYRLQEKVANYKLGLQSSSSSMNLQDMRNLQASIAHLIEIPPSPDLETLLNEQLHKLNELKDGLEKVSAGINDLFGNVVQCRRELIDDLTDKPLSSS